MDLIVGCLRTPPHPPRGVTRLPLRPTASLKWKNAFIFCLTSVLFRVMGGGAYPSCCGANVGYISDWPPINLRTTQRENVSSQIPQRGIDVPRRRWTLHAAWPRVRSHGGNAHGGWGMHRCFGCEPRALTPTLQSGGNSNQPTLKKTNLNLHGPADPNPLWDWVWLSCCRLKYKVPPENPVKVYLRRSLELQSQTDVSAEIFGGPPASVFICCVIAVGHECSSGST